jgi:hypothetical protein
MRGSFEKLGLLTYANYSFSDPDLLPYVDLYSGDETRQQRKPSSLVARQTNYPSDQPSTCWADHSELS